MNNLITNGDFRIVPEDPTLAVGDAENQDYVSNWSLHGLLDGGGGAIGLQRTAFTTKPTSPLPQNVAAYVTLNEAGTERSAEGTTYALLRNTLSACVPDLAGQTLELSFYAKSESGGRIGVRATVDYGSGGSTDVEALNQNIPILSGTWAKYTVKFIVPELTGKTFGADNEIRVDFIVDNPGVSLPGVDTNINLEQAANVSLTGFHLKQTVAVAFANSPLDAVPAAEAAAGVTTEINVEGFDIPGSYYTLTIENGIITGSTLTTP